MVQTESDAMDVPDAVDGEDSTCSTHSQAETVTSTCHFHLEFLCRNCSDPKMDNTSVIGLWALPTNLILSEKTPSFSDKIRVFSSHEICRE
jgi:hypothetical protein